MLSVRHPLNAECAAGESSLLYALPVPSNPSSTTLKCIDLLGQSVQRHFTLATLSHGIRQIETSSIDGGTQILGVRGQGSCYYYKLQENDVREIDIVQFRVDVAHMTQSPWLCESAVALNDGSICLWSAHDNRKELQLLREPKITSTLSDWKQVAYSSHPRTLLYGNLYTITRLDSRTPKHSSDSIVATAGYCSQFSALISCPHEPFQFATACSHYVSVMDSRMNNRPLIRWQHHFEEDPPSYLAVLGKPSWLLAAHVRQGQVVAYHHPYNTNGTQELGQNSPAPACLQGLTSRLPSKNEGCAGASARAIMSFEYNSVIRGLVAIQPQSDGVPSFMAACVLGDGAVYVGDLFAENQNMILLNNSRMIKTGMEDKNEINHTSRKAFWTLDLERDFHAITEKDPIKYINGLRSTNFGDLDALGSRQRCAALRRIWDGQHTKVDRDVHQGLDKNLMKSVAVRARKAGKQHLKTAPSTKTFRKGGF